MISFEVLCAILILLYLLLMWKADKAYPILYLFIFIYFLQYIFSTYLIYNQYAVMEDQMEISESLYFDYAIPAVCFLFLGVLLYSRNNFDFRDLLQNVDKSQARQMGYFLLIISYGMDFLQLAGLGFLSSVVSFTGFLKYVGAFCLIFTNSKFNYFVVALLYFQLAASALFSGVFITFFIWSTYLFFFICLRFRLPFLVRSLFFLAVLPVVFAIQSVKHEYRKQTWSGKKERGIDVFSDLIAKNQEQEKSTRLAESKGVMSTIGRLTQGWHLGLILRQVPRRQPIANGEEMLSDIGSAILPRLIFSDKKSVNSQEKFEQYTGHRLYGTTSMSVGVIGDFYLNFGRTGSYIGLFFFGAFIAIFYKFFLRKYVINDPINIVFIPFILTYLVRANNDFYIFFNGMVKGFIIFLFINYVKNKFLKNIPVSRPAPKPLPI